MASAVSAQVDGNARYFESAGNNQYRILNQQNFSDRNPSTAPQVNENMIALTVNGLMNIVATRYVAVFNIVQIGETVTSTDSLMNLRIGRFKKAMQDIGIAQQQIETDMISFVPKYTYDVTKKVFSKSYNEVPDGFELQKNIIVSYGDASELDRILSAASGAEIYDLVKVDYFVPDIQKSLDSLRMACLNEIGNKIKQFEGIGFKLDTMKKSFDEDYTTTYPPSRYYSYNAFSRPSLDYAKKKDIVNNTHTQVASKYYSQIDYDKYDIVLHPYVYEPVVQISYSVSVHYYSEKETQQKTIYVISNDGRLKPVTIN